MADPAALSPDFQKADLKTVLKPEPDRGIMLEIQNKEDFSMDIQKIISELVSKVTGDSDLLAKLTADPIKMIKDLIGIDVNADQVKEIIDGVTKALGGNVADAVGEGKGLLDKLKGIFGK